MRQRFPTPFTAVFDKSAMAVLWHSNLWTLHWELHLRIVASSLDNAMQIPCLMTMVFVVQR